MTLHECVLLKNSDFGIWDCNLCFGVLDLKRPETIFCFKEMEAVMTWDQDRNPWPLWSSFQRQSLSTSVSSICRDFESWGVGLTAFIAIWYHLLGRWTSIYICIYIYMCIYMCMYCLYRYIERERVGPKKYVVLSVFLTILCFFLFWSYMKDQSSWEMYCFWFVNP